MAWGEKNKMEQRRLFCEAILNKGMKKSEACRQFGISRPTGDYWLERYEKDGPAGLSDLSSARKEQGQKTSLQKEDMIILTKAEYPYFGPKKILPKLQQRYPEVSWPGTTTIGNILLRNGLVKSRRLRRLLAENYTHLYESKLPNDTWCMDFKGWHLTKDNQKFDPFTLTDQQTRYLIRCNQLNTNDGDHVWAILQMAFREYGLPLYLRSDNGPPFATTCPGRLSKLAVKLIKAGVTPEWIEPGEPQQNGRHERMHLTMKQECSLLGLSMEEQTKRLHEFHKYYNFERPHEALDQKTPGSIYTPSKRVWSGKLNKIEYPEGYDVAKVICCGNAHWKGRRIYISRVLSGERVGIKENEGEIEMYYANIFLGTIIEDSLIVKRRQTRQRV